MITKKISNYTIQLLTNLINVKHLLHPYANVIQQLDNSSWELFTIAYAVDITFGFNPEKSTYNVTQM